MRLALRRNVVEIFQVSWGIWQRFGQVATLVAGFVFVASCAGSEVKAGLGPSDAAQIARNPDVTPASITLGPAGSQLYSVTGTLEDGTADSAPVVSWGATGGTITSGGLYTAGDAPGSFRVIAVHQSGIVADTATVLVEPSAPVVLTGLSLSPSVNILAPGATLQFGLICTWSSGGSEVPPVSYTVTGGTISGTGLYVAPAATGDYLVPLPTWAGRCVTLPWLLCEISLLGLLKIFPGTTQRQSFDRHRGWMMLTRDGASPVECPWTPRGIWNLWPVHEGFIRCWRRRSARPNNQYEATLIHHRLLDRDLG